MKGLAQGQNIKVMQGLNSSFLIASCCFTTLNEDAGLMRCQNETNIPSHVVFSPQLVSSTALWHKPPNLSIFFCVIPVAFSSLVHIYTLVRGHAIKFALAILHTCLIYSYIAIFIVGVGREF